MGWEEGTVGEGVADETEEFFPAAGDYETDVFGVGRSELVLVDCALGCVNKCICELSLLL